MRLKLFSIIILILLFAFCVIFLRSNDEYYYVKEVISPCEVVFDDNTHLKISDLFCLDTVFTAKNKEIAQKYEMSEEDAFILANLGKEWARKLLEGRKVRIADGNLLYHTFDYKIRLKFSPYCLDENLNFVNEYALNKLVEVIKRSNYQLLNVQEDKFYPIDLYSKAGNFILVKKGYKKSPETNSKINILNPKAKLVLNLSDVSVIVSDLTLKLKPDRSCSTDICKAILNNIKSANSTIDLAIYGYSAVPDIENALKDAINRGVKIRLVYDVDAAGKNIYDNTFELVNLISKNKNDSSSKEVSAIMHNKFYIFDSKTVITGSANLSPTDMSGFNANSIIIINSESVAKVYTQEFEQMFNGKFHSDKSRHENKGSVYFSPQDKAITNGVLPLIAKAEKYIYIPTFLITEKRIVEELINSKNRGVDVKIIADALNASAKYSKVKDLRAAGILVKIENYAGKMHSKTMIIDDKYLVIGSMNFSNSGENKNDENLIILENKQAAIFYKEFFLSLWDKIPDKWLKFYPRAEGKDSIGSCSDGIDNDYDGLIDLAEEACK